MVFDVGTASSGGTATVVPAGSYVKVRILTGVEANPRDEIPMLVQADHALVGPNKRRIDLRGCMVLLQVKGELSTDRVVGQAVRLSCVREDGESVTRDINGYLAGEDSTFGVTGQLITRQGRVVAAAAVAGFAEAAGDAVARAQETRQLVQSPLSTNATEVRNVDGNQTAYVLGTSAAGSAEIIANWYLKYADQLLPAIAVGSGRDVWVVLLETVDVPPLEAP
jgi:conjugal transfer pilus assembly protein TraB